MRWRVLSVAFFATVLAVHLVPAQKLGRSGTARYDLANEVKTKAVVEELANPPLYPSPF